MPLEALKTLLDMKLVRGPREERAEGIMGMSLEGRKWNGRRSKNHSISFVMITM